MIYQAKGVISAAIALEMLMEDANVVYGYIHIYTCTVFAKLAPPGHEEVVISRRLLLLWCNFFSGLVRCDGLIRQMEGQG